MPGETAVAFSDIRCTSLERQDRQGVVDGYLAGTRQMLGTLQIPGTRQMSELSMLGFDIDNTSLDVWLCQ